MQALRIITAFLTCLHPTGGKPGDSASYRGLEFFSYQTLIAKIESGNRLFVDTRFYSKTTAHREDPPRRSGKGGLHCPPLRLISKPPNPNPNPRPLIP